MPCQPATWRPSQTFLTTTWCGPSADPSTFCRSARVGKYLVMKLLGRDSPTLWSRRRFVATTMLVDGDRPSVIGRLTGTKRASGQAISYRIAHFIQFRYEKVIDYVSIIDKLRCRRTIAGLQS